MPTSTSRATRHARARRLFSGTLAGDALRIDAPQYGMHCRDGRLRAHARAQRRHRSTSSTFAGGDGTLHRQRHAAARATRATDEPARASRGTPTSSALFNRPDLRLVVGGDGTLAIAQHKLASGRQGRRRRGPRRLRARPCGAARRRRRRQGPAARPRPRQRSRAHSAAAARPRRRPRRRADVLAAKASRRALAGRVHVTTARERHARRQGHDPRGARHLLRVRPAARRSTAAR